MYDRPPKIIYLYAGRGAASYLLLLEGLKESLKNKPEFEIRTFDSEFIRQTGYLAPDRVQAIILPGGAKPQYDKTIGQHGFDVIRNFVHSGGKFLGVCAGAYYASRSFEWTPSSAETVHKTPGLDFFNGLARGPVVSSITHDKGYDSWYDLSLANVTLQQKNMSHRVGQCVYWGGPLFYPDEKEDTQPEVMATMDVSGNPEPAILKIQHGDGQVVLSNIHPEISADHLRKYTGIPSTPEDEADYLKKIVSHLEMQDRFRETIWSYIIDELTQESNNKPQTDLDQTAQEVRTMSFQPLPKSSMPHR